MTLLVFDCDGVLVDSEGIALAVLAQALAGLDLRITPAECRRRFMGKSRRDVSAEIEALLGRRVPQGFGEAMKAQLFARLARELRPVAGVPETLARLPYAACVASSSEPDRIALSLDVTGLAPLFEGRTFSASEVRRGKPAPDLFLHVAKSLGVSPHAAIVIEDSPTGVIAARRADMRAIGFAGASHADDELAKRLAGSGAEEVVTRMTDLPAAIERLRAKSGAGAVRR